VHVHLRLFKLSDIPIGEVTIGSTVNVGLEASETDRARFDEWLRARWTEKDARLKRFHATGYMDDCAKVVEMPIAVRGLSDLFALGAAAVVPLWVGNAAWKLSRAFRRQ
jgi:hypothetical protein